MLKYEVMNEWRRQHPSIDSWLTRLGEGTQRRYLEYAYEFFQWLKENGGKYPGKTPEEMLDLQEGANGRGRFEQLQLIQFWIQQKKARISTKTLIHSALRGFYQHNHVPLPRDPSFTFRSDIPPVQGELSVEDFKKIVLSSNTMYQFVFMAMFQGGMDEASFEYFNLHGWQQIEPQLKRGQQRLKISLPGRKRRRNIVPFYTFMGKDAIQKLHLHLKERGTIKNGEPVCYGEHGEPLSKEAIRKYFHRHAVKVGVIKQYTPPCPSCKGETRRVRSKAGTGTHKVYYICNSCDAKTPASKINMERSSLRYGCNAHEIRDLFRSEWELSGARGIVAEFMLGHSIDPNKYNKIMKLHPEWAEGQYSIAEPYLNILSEDPRHIPVDRVLQLEHELRAAREKLALVDASRGNLAEDVTALKHQMEEILTRLEKK